MSGTSRWWYWMLATPGIAVLWALSVVWTWAAVAVAGVSLDLRGFDYVGLPLAALGIPLAATVLVLPFAVRRDSDPAGAPVANPRLYELGAWTAIAVVLLAAVMYALSDRRFVFLAGIVLATLLDGALSVAYLRERAERVGLRPLPTRSA